MLSTGYDKCSLRCLGLYGASYLFRGLLGWGCKFISFRAVSDVVQPTIILVIQGDAITDIIVGKD